MVKGDHISGLNPSPTMNYSNYGYGMIDSCGFYLIWFVILFVLIWFILYSLKPAFVQNVNGNGAVDNSKVLLAALIISIIIVLLIWLVRRSSTTCY